MSLSRPAALADPVFQNSWVKSNVAVTFDHLITQDGFESQLHRQLGVYAVAACAGLQYVHTASFQHFSHLNKSQGQHLAHKINTMLGIPQSPQAQNSSWRVVDLDRDCSISWDTLLNETRAAVDKQVPTLFNVSFTYGFELTYPAMLQCVPAFRQQVGLLALAVLLAGYIPLYSDTSPPLSVHAAH